MITQNPLISVIMPVYNGELYLKEAIESILAQTFADFEFIIIDDGSTDNTADIINSYKDQRIKYFRNDVNQGVAKSLNKGLETAQAEFIARMDADDISLPSRFQKQIEYLNEHLEIGVLGSWTQFIDEKGDFISLLSPPTSHAVIVWALLFANCMTHASVVFRRKLIKEIGGYTQDALYGEDYHLWVRMGRITRLANLDEVLVYKRLHGHTIESRFSKEQEQARARIVRWAISGVLNRNISDEEFLAIDRLNQNMAFRSFYERKLAAGLIVSLVKNFFSQRTLSPGERRKVYADAIEKIWNIAHDGIVGFSMVALYLYCKAVVLNPYIFVSFITHRSLNKFIKR